MNQKKIDIMITVLREAGYEVLSQDDLLALTESINKVLKKVDRLEAQATVLEEEFEVRRGGHA